MPIFNHILATLEKVLLSSRYFHIFIEFNFKITPCLTDINKFTIVALNCIYT